ncbi:unnamed protein product, partial [Musa acuminata subsp. burmannicoides]
MFMCTVHKSCNQLSILEWTGFPPPKYIKRRLHKCKSKTSIAADHWII